MPIASVLFAAALLGQSPIKLVHTFTKDSKTNYSVSMTLDDAEIVGDILFEATDEKGEALAKSAGIKMTMGGNSMDSGPIEDKIKFDEKGLATGLVFQNDRAAIVVLCLAGFCPNAEVKLDSLFDIAEKRDGYSVKGTGKLLAINEVEGKKQAKMEYNFTVKPGDDEEGIVKFTSVIDVATGKLVSAEGTLEVEGKSGKIKIKRK